jgi:hypothetical protein
VARHRSAGSQRPSTSLGRHRILAVATLLACLAGAVCVSSADAGTYARPRLMVSAHADRSSAAGLDGATLRGLAYIFVKPGRATIERVEFTLDPGTATARQVIERFLPFDFGRTNADGTAGPLDVSMLAAGAHAMTARIMFSDRRDRVLSAAFNVTSGATNPSSPEPTTAPTTTSSTSVAAPTTTTTTTSTTTNQAPTSTTSKSTTTTAVPTNTTPVSRTCANPVFETSDTNGGWSNGGYYVHNNMWNAPRGTETLYACAYNNWYVDSKQPATTSVKTYPNVHLDVNGAKGYPINNFRTITSTFAAVSPRVGIYNVAYDIWLNGVASPGSYEFMIWTENFKQRPAGDIVNVVTLSGVTYDVWRNGNYLALVPRAVMLSGTLNLKEMFDWAVSQGYLPPNPTVNQIDYGVEICSTNDTWQRFTFTEFSVTMA